MIKMAIGFSLETMQVKAIVRTSSKFINKKVDQLEFYT